MSCPVASSLPVRGAWIEIRSVFSSAPSVAVSLPVRGAWIEILENAEDAIRETGRSPCGERGLKCQYGRTVAASAASLPVRGAWIEMVILAPNLRNLKVAPRAGSVD